MHVRKSMIAAAAGFCLTIAVGAGVQAQTITIGLGTEPTSIDPHYHNLGPNNQIAQHIFSRLIEQDHKQRLLPGLATEWKAVDDTTWEFKLRRGVKFHDGSDFNADDVLFSMERAAAHPNARASFKLYSHGGEKAFSKVDDYTVRVTTPSPYPLMAVDLSNVAIVSDKAKGHWEGEFNNGNQAAGTGPYRFVRWVKGEILEFERNESYWGKKPHWKKVVIRPIKSSPSRLAALLAGDVDLIDQVPTVDVAGLKKNPKISLSQGISNRVIYLHLDQYRDVTPFAKGPGGEEIKNPFKDARVRRAISKAINRGLIIERVMEGIAVPAGQLLPDGFFGVSSKLKPEAYDPEGAKKLLAEAGYPKGFQTTLHGPNDRYINDAKIAEAVAQMLSRVGIWTTPETMPKSVYFKRVKNGGPAKPPEFSFILVGWGSGTGEASSPLRSLLATYDKDKGLIPLHYQVNTWAARKGLKYLARTDERTVAYDIQPE